jgi:soluble lytic murein transglycosylase-like protein
VDFIGYLFWGGLVLALSAGMLLARSNSLAKAQTISKSARLWKYFSTGASMLAGLIILSAGLVAADAFLQDAPPPQSVADWVQPYRASGEGTPPFGRWDEESPSAFAQLWPHAPPKIGKLKLKQEYWGYIKEAAQRYHISPYLIQAVCAIESRYDPKAKSGKGRCLGLMQLEKDTAKKYGVDPHNPRENIMGGAAVLAILMQKYHGDIRNVLHVYNATCTAAYEREVIRAYNQAEQFEMVSLPPQKSKN